MFKRQKLVAAAIALLSASIFAPAWSDSDGAKGLFYEQLEKPAATLNTGVQYWIELHREGKVMRVNNKTAFRSGDKIRFHVKSNVDAFAYILLKEGSGGEQAVLFPDTAHHDETKVIHGRDYPLPGDGFLTFDEHPGTERLLLLLSRTPVDAQAYLENNKNDRAQIAALPDGSKDLIPAKIVLAYEPPKDAFKDKVSEATPAVTKIASSTTASTYTPPKASSSTDSSTKHSSDAGSENATATTVSKAGKHATKTGKTPAGKDKPIKPHTPIASAQPVRVLDPSGGGLDAASPYNGGLVTVVHKDPQAVLALDLSLDHER